MATMFVTLPGKGGVGKSCLTAAFAQWLVDRGRLVACIDTATLNPTLLRYKWLKAPHRKLSQNYVIDPQALDALVGRRLLYSSDIPIFRATHHVSRKTRPADGS